MTSSEMRDLITAYWKLQSSEGELASELMTSIEEAADEYASKSRAGHWAGERVGVVLAAGLTAAVEIADMNTTTNLWRVCGLQGRRTAMVGQAIDVLEQMSIGREAQVGSEPLRLIAAKWDRNPRKITAPASYTDVLMWMCHSTCGPFLHRLARHIGEELVDGPQPYLEMYRQRLEYLRQADDPEHWTQAKRAMLRTMMDPKRPDLEALLAGLYPAWKIEEKARDSATRLFLADYWTAAQAKFCAVATV